MKLDPVEIGGCMSRQNKQKKRVMNNHQTRWIRKEEKIQQLKK